MFKHALYSQTIGVSAAVTALLACACLATTPALAQPATVVQWSFDQDPMDPALELHGQVERVAGREGGAMRFNGASTWAQGPTVASLGLMSEGKDEGLLDGQAVGVETEPAKTGFTIDVRVRPHRLEGDQVILESYETQGDQRSLSLALSDNRAVFVFSTDGTWRGSLDGGLRSDLRLKPGQWNDIRVHFDGRFISMTINGQVDTARAFCPGVFPAQRPIQIGRRYDGKEAGAYFLGDLDHVRFERTDMPAAEVSAEVPPLEPGMRNNMVLDLLEVEAPAAGDYTFELPEAGWVCFMLRGAGGAASIVGDGYQLMLDDQTDHLAMKRLPAGKHTVSLRSPHGETAGSLVVRRVPEMMYVKYGYGPYDWEFLQQNVLRYTNVCVSAVPPIKVTTGSTRWYVPDAYAERMGDRLNDTDAVMQAWTASGREWIVEMHSGYWDGQDAWRDALPHWRKGFEDGLSGVLVDEFGYYYAQQAYEAWSDHIARLREESPEGRFYAFVFGLERFPSNHVFLNEVRERDGRIVWECYIREQPTEADARRALREKLIEPMTIASQLMPGLASQVVLCPSTWTGMGAFTDDFFPEVDQKVFLDMQFHVFATEPAFRSLGGLGPWTSGYSSPEMIRWLGALYRHYGIEGNTELLSAKLGYSYTLDHLDGAGFENPRSLSLEPATADSLVILEVSDLPSPITVPGKSYVQPLGEKCLQFTYSQAAPNRVRQAVTNLKPGELYSVQFHALDLDTPTERPDQPIPFTLEIAGGEWVESLEEQVVIASTRPGTGPVFVTRYHLVFRADGTDAELSLSDWSAQGADVARDGRRVICDNLAVQPYFSETQAAEMQSAVHTLGGEPE